MNTYQYQLIRYQHDHFTGEFVNMGIIVYSPEMNFLECKVTNRYQRLNDFFPAANGKFTRKILHHIEQQIRKAANTLQELFAPSNNLLVITDKILPPDNNAIRLSEVRTALDVDMNAALHYLYFEMVEKNTEEAADKTSLSDEEVWKNKYKQYFDKYNLSNTLTKHVVETPNDKFEFDLAWKNEIWHCYQPVSFYLVNKDSIKDKVYKWAGRVKGLQEAREKVHLTLLASLNPEYAEMKSFMDHFIEVHNNPNISVDVVLENDAEKIAKSIRRQMDEHTEAP
jgi:hypothetical protein